MTPEERRSEQLRHQAIKASASDANRRPETVAQARTWEVVKNAYRRDGLCDTCAAQAAWGHQNGFALIRPPCPACAPIVASFPTPAGADSPWRRWPRGTSRPTADPESPTAADHTAPDQSDATRPLGPAGMTPQRVVLRRIPADYGQDAPCPTCDVPAGTPCSWSSWLPHPARVDQLDRAGAAGDVGDGPRA